MNPTAKTWCYTLNNYTDEEYVELVNANDGVTYHVIGKEVGEQGTPHLQGCITFQQTKRFNWVKEYISQRAHIEKANSTNHARAYCKKDGDFIVIDNREQGRRTDLDEAIESLEEGGLKRVKEMHPATFVKYPTGFEKLAASKLPPRDPNEPPQVYWLWGDTGVGKTRWVYQNWRVDEIYMATTEHKWYDGYVQQPVLCLDDFRGSDMKFNQLLRLCDRYPHQVEFKGGMVHINSGHIIITSNASPEDTYAGVTEENMQQLIRRCTWICNFLPDGARHSSKDERVILEHEDTISVHSAQAE